MEGLLSTGPTPSSLGCDKEFYEINMSKEHNELYKSFWVGGRIVLDLKKTNPVMTCTF